MCTDLCKPDSGVWDGAPDHGGKAHIAAYKQLVHGLHLKQPALIHTVCCIDGFEVPALQRLRSFALNAWQPLHYILDLSLNKALSMVPGVMFIVEAEAAAPVEPTHPDCSISAHSDQLSLFQCKLLYRSCVTSVSTLPCNLDLYQTSFPQ